MPAPTFVASYASVFNTAATPKTVSVTTQPGDVLVVYGGTENAGDTLTTPSGNSLSFTLQQSITVASYCPAFIWTAIDSSGGTSWTLSCGNPAGNKWGFACLVFRGSGGIGASSQANTTGAPSLGITTTADNSAVVVFSDDFNNVNGSSRTWRTDNSITPNIGNGLETTYAFQTSSYTSYGAYYSDAGTAGSNTLGLSAPTGQKYSIVGVEVLGTQQPQVSTSWWKA